MDIPNKRMTEKLEALLSDVSGEFSYRPRIVSGLEQLTVFRNNGIPCPEFTLQLREARKWVEAGHAVFGRNRRHEKGVDIVIPGSATWDRKEFWSKVIPVSREYRIHIFANEQIQRSLKTFDPNAPPDEGQTDSRYVIQIQAGSMITPSMLLRLLSSWRSALCGHLAICGVASIFSKIPMDAVLSWR